MMKRIFAAIALAASLGAGPPLADQRPVTDDYFGTKIVDPYRYFENLKDPVVAAWIKAQADYAHEVLSTIPGRDQLLKRIQELDAGAPYRRWIVRRWPNGDFHYLQRLASENIEKLYFHEAASDKDRLLVDPDRFIKPGSGSHFALEFAVPSPDERLLVYGVASAGSEQTTLHLMDNNGKDLPDVIDRMEADYLPPQWLPDGKAFLYARRRMLPPGTDPTEAYKQSTCYLHRLGANPDADQKILGMGISPAVPLAEADFPAIAIARGSHFAVAQIKHGDDVQLTLYSAPIDSLTSSNIPWKKICDVNDKVQEYAVHGDEIFLRTAAKAARYEIVKTALADPDFLHAEIVLPQGKTVIEDMQVGRDALYVTQLDGGLERVVRLEYGKNEAMESIKLPDGFPSIFLINASADMDGALIGSTSWVRAGAMLSFDPATHQLTDIHLNPVGKFDNVPGFESREVMVVSHDGAAVPLSILCKTGIALDGSHPTLLEGYGAYGISMTTYFKTSNLAWLERGGVLAIAHVRGGGEFGDAWHLAGQKSTKPNTWKDLIACGEYLVKQGYTTPAKLAGQGGSAGGITIGRAITERPDLWAAALINVGATDSLRFETTANGVPNIPEFGSVKTREGFEALRAMSAYANITDGVKYPAVLLTHGINDPRVDPWMSAKMTARLQAASTSGKPILFRVDYDAGHGIGSTKLQKENELADEWAFLLWQLGEADFQRR